MGPLSSSSSKPDFIVLSFSHGCSSFCSFGGLMYHDYLVQILLDFVTWSLVGEVAGQGRSCRGRGLSVKGVWKEGKNTQLQE